MDHIGFKNLPPPNLAQQAVNLAKELPALIKSGFKRVPDEIYEQRIALCMTCYFWKDKCTHPKCGCSKEKQRQSSQRCPVGTWGAYV